MMITRTIHKNSGDWFEFRINGIGLWISFPKWGHGLSVYWHYHWDKPSKWCKWIRAN